MLAKIAIASMLFLAVSNAQGADGYRPVDLRYEALIVTPRNAGAKVEVTAPLRMWNDSATGVFFIPGYQSPNGISPTIFARVELTKLSESQINALRAQCPDYDPCMARWDITLLRHEDSLPSGFEFRDVWLMPTGTEVVSLDAWRR